MTDCAGKTWLITGASSGLGAAIAREVVARGGRIVATARDPAGLADLARLAPDRVLVLPLDVTRQEQIDAAVAGAVDRFGGIDILVNNAGYGLLSAVEEANDAEIRRQFDVNLFGLAAVTRAVLPFMREQGRGTIVMMSSILGARGNAGVGYYCASKFAVEGLSESLAIEAAPFGIGVLIVEPGPFRTDFGGRSIAGPAKPIAAYQDAARIREFSAKLHGSQAGDPVRAAALIVDTVSSEAPLLRLLLGAEGFAMTEQAIRHRLEDIARSREIAPRADFPAEPERGDRPSILDAISSR